MTSPFDCLIDRSDTNSIKWSRYGEDVLPMWVADMDFRSPDVVISALQERVAHGVFGYGTEPSELRELLVERMQARYHWEIMADDIVFIPGVVVGFNLAAQACATPGQGLLLQTPVYYPMFETPQHAGLSLDQMQLTETAGGRYVVDLDLMERSVTERTRIFLLCNPHNPVGRAFTHEELAGMAEICLRHDLIICSDEIHCELTYPGHEHTPIASLDPAVARRTVTLMAPSKTFNIAGLKFAFAIIQDPELRQAFQSAQRGIVPSVSVLAYQAGLAAYQHGDPWLIEALDYLRHNRDLVCGAVAQEMPGISVTPPEATYLAWLDCRQAALPGGPCRFFLRQARVALSDGAAFGPGGEGFVRLNFGCCESLLRDALERMCCALHAYR